jgi:hypothetical protein
MGTVNAENFILSDIKLHTKNGITINLIKNERTSSEVENAELLVNYVAVLQEISQDNTNSRGENDNEKSSNIRKSIIWRTS